MRKGEPEEESSQGTHHNPKVEGSNFHGENERAVDCFVPSGLQEKYKSGKWSTLQCYIPSARKVLPLKACYPPFPPIAQKWGAHCLELFSESQGRWEERAAAAAAGTGFAKASFPGHKKNTAACLPISTSEPIISFPFPFLFQGIQLSSLQYEGSKGGEEGHNYSFKLSCPLGNMLKDRSS